jgi:hypothetical protein
MALPSLRNHRDFYSDYWLGTILAGRTSGGARLSPAQSRKALERITRWVESMRVVAEPDLTRYRERFARPLLLDFLGFDLHENAAEPRLRPISVASATDSRSPVALVLLCPDSEDIDSRQWRRRLEDELIARGLDHGFMISTEVLRLIRRPGLGNRAASFDLALAPWSIFRTRTRWLRPTACCQRRAFCLRRMASGRSIFSRRKVAGTALGFRQT